MEPDLVESTATFTQEGNTLGTTSFIEELTVRRENSGTSDSDDAFFYVIVTTGWSFDSPEALLALLERCKIAKPAP